MYRQIVHFLQGQVLVRIECGCPERMLNLCGARGIPFWELTWESPVCLTLRAVGRDRPRLRQAAEDAGGSLHLCRSGGVPVFWRRLRRRYAYSPLWEGCLMGDKKRLARAGLEVMDRLDLPGELAAGVGRMELVGDRQFYMEQHRGVLRYSTEVIDIAAADMTVRITGRELQLLAMTDRELRISGTIAAIELLT